MKYITFLAPSGAQAQGVTMSVRHLSHSGLFHVSSRSPSALLVHRTDGT